jgi:hypothetical protein
MNRSIPLGVIFSLPNPEELKRRIAIGDRLENDEGSKYIVACPDADHVVLINLSTGHRFSCEPVETEDSCCLTEVDVRMMIGGDSFERWQKTADSGGREAGLS